MSQLINYEQSYEFSKIFNINNTNKFIHTISGPLIYLFFFGVLQNINFLIPFMLQIGLVLKLSYMFPLEKYKNISILYNVLYLKTVFFNYSLFINTLLLLSTISSHFFFYKDNSVRLNDKINEYIKYLILSPIISIDKMYDAIINTDTETENNNQDIGYGDDNDSSENLDKVD